MIVAVEGEKEASSAWVDCVAVRNAQVVLGCLRVAGLVPSFWSAHLYPASDSLLGRTSRPQQLAPFVPPSHCRRYKQAPAVSGLTQWVVDHLVR